MPPTLRLPLTPSGLVHACRGLLAQYNPEIVLVVAEAQDSGVAKAVAASQLYECVPVPRREWDDSAGFLDLTAYALPEDRARLEGGGSLQSMAGNYLAYAAAGAVLKWVHAASAAAVPSAPVPSVQTTSPGAARPAHLCAPAPHHHAAGTCSSTEAWCWWPTAWRFGPSAAAPTCR